MCRRDGSVLRCLFAVGALLRAISVHADTCAQQNSNGISSGDVLNISGVSSDMIASAIGYWSGPCPGYGTSFPSMTAGGSGGIPVTVTHTSGNSTLATGSCGRTTFSLQGPGNTVISANVQLFDRQSNGVECNLSDTLAHELGHVLGLADNSTSTCVGRIMGGRPPGGTRTVASDDCIVAGQRWTTSGDGGGGGGGDGCLPD
jgi:hypothetical protein